MYLLSLYSVEIVHNYIRCCYVAHYCKSLLYCVRFIFPLFWEFMRVKLLQDIFLDPLYKTQNTYCVVKFSVSRHIGLVNIREKNEIFGNIMPFAALPNLFLYIYDGNLHSGRENCDV